MTYCTYADKHTHTHTEPGQQGTVPVASLIKQWQLYYSSDKPDFARGEREGERESEGESERERERETRPEGRRDGGRGGEREKRLNKKGVGRGRGHREKESEPGGGESVLLSDSHRAVL